MTQYPHVKSFVSYSNPNLGINTVEIRITDDLAFYRIKDKLVAVEAGPYLYCSNYMYLPRMMGAAVELRDVIGPRNISANMERYVYAVNGTEITAPSFFTTLPNHYSPQDQQVFVTQIMSTYGQMERKVKDSLSEVPF